MKSRSFTPKPDKESRAAAGRNTNMASDEKKSAYFVDNSRAGQRQTRLAQIVQRANAEHPVQRGKNEYERGKKARRKAKYPDAVRTLAPLVKPALEKHIFEGLKLDGSIDKSSPQGLHAYVNGSLHGNIDSDSAETEGSIGSVHTLKWKYKTSGDGVALKRSSMFPGHLSKNDVKTIVAAEYTKDNKVVTDPKEYVDRNIALPKDELLKRAWRGGVFRLRKSGETVYPIK